MKTLEPDVPAVAHWPERVLTFPQTREGALDPSLEWIVTNGLGGYASAPVCGGLTRRYHGLLIAALPPPLGRIVCVTAVRTTLVIGERHVLIDHESLPALTEASVGALREFRLDGGLPRWIYEVDGLVLEKRVVMSHRRNTTTVIFSVLQGDQPVRLELALLLNLRPHEHSVDQALGPEPDVRIEKGTATILFDASLPSVRWRALGTATAEFTRQDDHAGVEFAEEGARGYLSAGQLWAPCRLSLAFADGLAAFSVSTDDDGGAKGSPVAVWEAERDRRVALLARAAPADTFAAELTLAADHFVIVPVGHAAAATPDAEPTGSSRSVIAGYHWFTDWGRDTMISLDGLTLGTGREREAAQILETFGRHVRDGLIPNLFPEGQRLGLYHTADATLWFFQAIHRYTSHTGDRGVVDRLLPTLLEIIECHRRGTLFGIGVDPADGLLRQGAPGYALTWMDAKVDGWVVTPRRGKAVEINALWYNALCLVADWLDAAGRPDDGGRCRDDAARARASFNTRFWNHDTGWLYDVIDGEQGDDPACRPNQLFAISLPHAVLDEAHWAAVVGVVREKLLTPLGLRTLSPDHPDYQSRYFGDLRRRDAAYHQGTVWPWLIGGYVDALLKVTPGAADEVREVLVAFPAHLSAAGIGSISEIADADSPHLPRGCIAQAWSVAEVRRIWRKLPPKTAPSSTT